MGAPTQLQALDPTELGKLRWACRRGMKELDILLARYLDERFCGASNPEQAAFRRLLEIQDTILYRYCVGEQPPPPEFATLIERITANLPADRIPLGSHSPSAGRC